MTQDNATPEPAPESAAPETVAVEPVASEQKDTPTDKPDGKTPPAKLPTEAPAAGLEYVLGADGLWHTRRVKTDAEVAADYQKATEKSDDPDDDEAAPTGPVELSVPEEVARQGAAGEDDVVLLGEASGMMSAAGYTQSQQQRLVEMYGLESMAHTDAPRAETHGQEAVLGYLREQWGSEYEARLDAAVKMTAKLGPKFERWLGETGLGDDPTMLSVLANVGRGLLSISKADAEKQIAAIRKAYVPHGKDSKLTLAKLRVLADRVARGEPNPEDARLSVASGFRKNVVGQIDKKGRSKDNVLHSLEESQADGFNKGVTAPAQHAQDAIGRLREQQTAVAQKFGRMSKEYKEVSARVRASYEAAYGTGEHRA